MISPLLLAGLRKQAAPGAPIERNAPHEYRDPPRSFDSWSVP
jgi:hypothetical protein